jgi:hypothetical protein
VSAVRVGGVDMLSNPRAGTRITSTRVAAT